MINGGYDLISVKINRIWHLSGKGKKDSHWIKDNFKIINTGAWKKVSH